MAYRNKNACRIALLFFLVLFCATLPAAEAAKAKRHFLSWESLRAPQRYQHLTRVGTDRRVELERRRVVRFEKEGVLRPYEFASPVYADGMIYVGTDAGKLFSINPKLMKKEWSFVTEGPIHARARIDGGEVFVGDIQGILYCLDAKTGEERWRKALDDEILSAPLVNQQHVYAVTQSGRLFALDRETGVEAWHTDALEKRWGFSVRRGSDPVFSGESILFGTATGLLVSSSQKNGQLNWVRQLGDQREQVFDIDSSPLVVGEHVYVASADGMLHALDRKSGKVLWSDDTGGANDLLFHGGLLFSSSGAVISAIDPETGFLRWQQTLEETIGLSSPAAGERFVAFVSTTRKLFLIDDQNGDLLAERFIRKGSLSDPIVVGNHIFLLSNRGKLFAFRVKERQKRKRSP